MSVSSQDKELLKRLALAEARGEGITGQALVIRSVLNRQAAIRNGANFNTRSTNIRDIVYAPLQYEPTRDSRNSIDQTFTAQQLQSVERAYQLALDPAKLQQTIEADGVGSATARNLVLSTGFDSLGGQGRVDAVQYKNHVFVENVNNFGVTGDSIYSSAPSSTEPPETATDSATGSKTDNNDPVPVPDKEVNVDNQFAQLSPEKIDSEIESRRKEIDELNKKANSTWTQEEQERHKQLSAELNSLFQAKLADEDPDCIVRETAKGFTFKGTPNCEKFFSSVAMQKAVEKYRSERDTANPCGTSEMAKINTALQKFFVAIKGIKNYGDLYVNGTLNRIENVTALIRSTSEIIGAVLKTLVNRLRDFLLDKIRRGIEDLIDILLPTIAKAIKNTVIQAIVDNIFCSFKDIIKNLANLAGDFLFELIGKIVNVPFCAAQQFTNALVNNVAAIVDKSVGPLLDEINDVLGGVTSIVGNVFQALDYILGFEAFLCAKPNCPEINKFKASPWGGPSKAEIDAFENFLAPLGGRQSPTAEGVIGSVDNFISDLEIFGGRVGDANQSPSSITTCDTDAFVCGPPKVEIFGGGGVGAVGQAIVDNIGRTIGVDLVFGGSGYTSPPFVSFVDSCEDTFTSGYAEIEDGKVVNVVMTTTPPAPPRDGRTEFDPPSEESTPDGNDYIVCLSGFRILNTGTGYTPNDSIQITPDIPGLVGGVQMTEVGQIFSIKLNEPVCGISEYPDITINSPTGEGAIIQPILSFTRVEETPDGDPDVVINQPLTTLRGRSVLAEADFTRKDIVRIVDCVS
jgi:hypothetical protein